MLKKIAMVGAMTPMVVALTVGGDAALARNADKHRPVVEISDARIKFEINATAGDGGIQVFLDAEPWREMTIFDPRGRTVFEAETEGSIGRNGGTELFLESGEPSFDDVPLEQMLRRFPAGNYRFEGRGLEGERLRGVAVLTHDLPDGPLLVSPEPDAVVDANHTVLMWESVAPPNGSPIVGYQVLVVHSNTGLKTLPKITLDVMMPPTATSFLVPGGFLVPGTHYEWEILAIEAGGNQTLSTQFFSTAE